MKVFSVLVYFSKFSYFLNKFHSYIFNWSTRIIWVAGNYLHQKSFRYSPLHHLRKKNFFFLKLIYFLISSKATSPKKRNLKFVYSFTPSPLLVKKFRKCSSRRRNFDALGHKSFNRNFTNSLPVSYFYIVYKLLYLFSLWSIGVSIHSHKSFNKLYLISLTSTGSYTLRPLSWGVRVPVIYASTTYNTLFNLCCPIGSFNFLKGFFVNTFYYCLFNSINRFAFSAGTFSKILKLDYSSCNIWIRLPSQIIKVLAFDFYGYLGRNSNIFSFKRVGGGSFSSFLGFRFFKKRNRGISMNPVDHPNGGRTNTKKPFRTPWGKIAKFGK